ncbi:putative F-box domain, kelch-type beta propeller, F-box-like domain superfamily [Helianthus anomalus]
MGGLLSKNSCKPTETLHVPHGESCKRQKTLSSLWDDKPRLIPNLPDEISLEIIARLPRICYLNVKGVSRSWKAAVTSSEIYKVRRELGTKEEWLYILTKNHGDKLFWHALDPVSKRWQRLPPVPNVHLEDDYKSGLSGSRMWNMVGSSIRIADVVRGWLGRKDGSDQIRFCGCTIGAVDGYLYMLGGFNRVSAMNCVWKYDPVSNSWSEANPMSVSRAYCKTGVLNNKLNVVGDVSRGVYQDDDIK